MEFFKKYWQNISYIVIASTVIGGVISFPNITKKLGVTKLQAEVDILHKSNCTLISLERQRLQARSTAFNDHLAIIYNNKLLDQYNIARYKDNHLRDMQEMYRFLKEISILNKCNAQ
jgi:hypothetical protein